MPLHDYCCDKCGFIDEYLTGATTGGKAPEICPKCKEGKMEKFFSATRIGIDFVGSGFYINDYGTHNWKANLSKEDQAKVLTPDINGNYKDPY